MENNLTDRLTNGIHFGSFLSKYYLIYLNEQLNKLNQVLWRSIVLLLCSQYRASLVKNSSALKFTLNGSFLLLLSSFFFESTTDNATRCFKCSRLSFTLIFISFDATHTRNRLLFTFDVDIDLINGSILPCVFKSAVMQTNKGSHLWNARLRKIFTQYYYHYHFRADEIALF